MFRKVLLLLVLIVLLFSLTGCQAIAGLGRDITWTAEETGDLLDGP
jgi:predicted small secreted protein